ncbi:MAG: RNA-binding S4 domain-containing protein [Bacillota bacterium]|jgi:ribosome-associated protein|nr:RNA-binding S4 domain-containing protein [Bacillota bacterium]
MNIAIESDYIALDALLKYANILPSGGLTRILLEEGNVYVNDRPVHERRKKIFPGDIVKILWMSEGIDVQLEVVKEE